MPVKPILQIQVDDTQFKRFKDLFDRYQTALSKLPQDWQKVAVAAGGVAEAHKKAQEAADKQTASVQKQASALNGARRDSESISQNWRSIALSAHGVDKALESAVVKMAKWGGLAAGVLGGLGAVGSLFGIDRLAGSIGAARTRAMGLGISYGQSKAYDINYSRLVHSSDVMSNVFTAKHDISSAQYKALMAAGISQKDIETKNTAQLMSEFMGKLPGLFAGVPQGMIGTKLHQYGGMDSVISLQDLNAYLSASPEERKSIEDKTQKDSKDIDLQDSVQRQWQDLITQIGRATETVKSHFMNKMAAIEPGLEKLSAQLTTMAVKFIDSPQAKEAINWLGVELNKFAEYIGKKEFQDDIRDFSKWVGAAAKGLWNFVSFFSGVGGAKADTAPSASGAATGDFQPGDVVDPVTGKRMSSSAGGPSSPGLTTAAQNAAGLRLMDFLVKERGWTPEAAAIAAGNAQQESGFNPNGPAGDPNVPGGSHGMFQWNRERLSALRAYAASTGHAWTEERTQEEFFAQEAERKIPNWKSERGFDSAGNISHAYEGYGDNSTGTRVANAKSFLKRYQDAHTKSVVIRSQSGANVPRSLFSVSQPYAPAAATQ